MTHETDNLRQLLLQDEYVLVGSETLDAIVNGPPTPTRDKLILAATLIHFLSNACCARCQQKLGLDNELVFTSDGTMHLECSS